MKTKMYLLVLYVILYTSYKLSAQTTLSTLPAIAVSGGTRGITFNVHANNAITVTEIGSASNNGMLTFVEIWYKTTAISGAPTINAANGWILLGMIPSMNITTGASSITSIPIPLNINIPIGDTYGFFLGCASGAIGYKNFISGACDFSDINATIQTGANIGYRGAAPNPAIGVSQFTGSIKYNLTGPLYNPVANFFPSQATASSVPTDTVWINSLFTIYANSTNSTRSYWRLPDMGTLNPGYTTQSVQFETQSYIDTAKYNSTFKYIFTTPGLKRIKILSINESNRLAYRDTVTKYIYVDFPNTKPVINFSADRVKIGIGDYAVLSDLSLNGPYQWYWTYNPGCILCQTPPYFNNFFTSTTNQNTLYFAGDPGTFSICLQAWNVMGWDTICKKDYIEVLNSINLCSGSGALQSKLSKGFMYGPSGPALSYTRSQVIGCQGFLLQPCADSIYLFVDRMKMLPSDTLVIHNGINASAPVLAKLGGSHVNLLPFNIKNFGLKGGSRIFIRFQLGTVNPPVPYDSAGFSIRWDIKPSSIGIPVSTLLIPDTIYSLQPILFSNASTGIQMQYSWDSDGNGIYDSTGATVNRTFSVTSAQFKKICLVTYNCVGSDTSCKNVLFMPITNSPLVRFDVDKIHGFNTDTFYFKDKSLFGPATWKWTFTPANVQFLQGTTPNSRNPIVRFISNSCYTVKLVASNSLGADSLTKICYVTIVSYNSPGCLSNISLSDGSIGISRVVLQAGIDTSTIAITPCYEWIQGNQLASLYRGKKHALTITRPGTSSPMDRKAWIDYNRDGDFTTNEQVMNELNATGLQRTDSILISNTQPIGKARMRVGVTYAGTQLVPNVTFLGVFKDFNINFPMDLIKPSITLNGSATLNAFIHAPFIDPGVTAIDNIEGNISNKCTVMGSVDTSKTGYNLLRYFVTDLYGNNSDTLSRIVFVVLNQSGPNITLYGSQNHYLEVYHKYTDPGFIARTSLGADISSLVVVTSNIDTAHFGNYTVTYSVTDAFGTAWAYRNITVGDTTKPVLVLPPNNIYKHHVGMPIDLYKIISATDNYWPSNKITIYHSGTVNVNTLGFYQVCYDAVDSSNNVCATTCIQVHVGDFKAPVITLKGPDTLKVEVHFDLIDSGAIGTDNYWPASTLLLNKKGVVNTHLLGWYTIWYIFTDPSLNKDSVSRVIKVVDTTKPRVNILKIFEINWPNHKLFVDSTLVFLEDNYNTDAEMRPFFITQYSFDKFALPYSIGLYSVRYKVKDLSGNESEEVRRTINMITGIGELMSIEKLMTIYPNPVDGLLFMELREMQKEDVEIAIFDMLGKELFNKTIKANTLQTETLDLHMVPKGFYLLKVQTGQNCYIKKLQVN